MRRSNRQFWCMRAGQHDQAAGGWEAGVLSITGVPSLKGYALQERLDLVDATDFLQDFSADSISLKAMPRNVARDRQLRVRDVR